MKYEIMLLIKSSATQDDEKKIFEQIKKGKPVFIGKKNLAYPIKKEKEGKYWLLEIEGEGNDVREISAKLELEETVLRYLIIKKDTSKKKE